MKATKYIRFHIVCGENIQPNEEQVPAQNMLNEYDSRIQNSYLFIAWLHLVKYCQPIETATSPIFFSSFSIDNWIGLYSFIIVAWSEFSNNSQHDRDCIKQFIWVDDSQSSKYVSN